MPATSDDPVREVRRLTAVVLVAVAAAAGSALGLGLHAAAGADPVAARGPNVAFPATFHEAGFVERPVTLVGSAAAYGTATTLRHGFTLTAGDVWVVARCDRGSVTVAVGGVTSTRPCAGGPVGVAALSPRARTLTVVVSVSRVQAADWGVAVYR